MEYVRICVHQLGSMVYVLGQSREQQDGLVVLFNTSPDNKHEAITTAKTLALEFNAEYGCEHPFELENDGN